MSELEYKTISIDLIDPHEENPRQHPDEQLAGLEASYQELGQFRSFVVWARPNGRYTQVTSHGITEAMRREGATHCRVEILPEATDPLRVKQIMLADNLHAQKSHDDDTLLVQLLQEQQDAGFDLASLGSSDESLREMLEQLGDEWVGESERDEEEDDFDVDPDSIEIRCRRGEIWQLGNHRLMVGDCTDSSTVRRLFQNDRAALVVTSPPYSDQRQYNLGSFNWNALMCGAFDGMIAHVEEDAHILINLGLKHKDRQVDIYWIDWLAHCSRRDWPLFGWYVWDQGSGLPGEWGGRLAPSHEFLFHFNQKLKYPNKWIETQEASRKPRAKHTSLRDKDGTVPIADSPDKYGGLYKIPDSVVRINREYARGIRTQNHPAVYPVALPEFVMQTWSNEDDIVYEPFCGSGTTIIAAENLSRRCYACEIDEKYASVILAGWEQHTGQSATLLQRLPEGTHV